MDATSPLCYVVLVPGIHHIACHNNFWRDQTDASSRHEDINVPINQPPLLSNSLWVLLSDMVLNGVERDGMG